MEPRLVLKSITFSDGTTIATTEASVVALVGPNNSGKSSTLREIRERASRSDYAGSVLKNAEFIKVGSGFELRLWLDQNAQKVKPRFSSKEVYSWLGRECEADEVEKLWARNDMHGLGEVLCDLIDVEKRLEVGNQQEPIDFFTEAPSRPAHVLYKNPELEFRVNEAFRTAFKTDVILNRGGGKALAFHVGTKPERSPSEDSVSPSYFKKLCKLPFLHDQGHGMRSFFGCMLQILASPAFIQLLDEPEAFLHPPHARLLAGLLARSAAKNRQLLIATHSGDFLRGLLDAGVPSLRVIRLIRDGSVNHTHELNSDSIRTLWADPILRFSNLLDAIFHDGAVLCEADSDCRFYSAVLNSVLEDSGQIAPDVMFAASGGKDRMPFLIRALRQLGVRIRVIADFDILREVASI